MRFKYGRLVHTEKKDYSLWRVLESCQKWLPKTLLSYSLIDIKYHSHPKMEHRLPDFLFPYKKRKQKTSRQNQRRWKIRKRNMQDKLCTTPDKTKIHLYVSRTYPHLEQRKIEMSGCSFPCAPSSVSRYTSRFSTASGNLVAKYFQLLVNDPRFLIQSLVNTKDNIMHPQTEPVHHHPPPASAHSNTEGKAFANETLLRLPGSVVINDVTNRTFSRNLKPRSLLRYALFLFLEKVTKVFCGNVPNILTYD